MEIWQTLPPCLFFHRNKLAFTQSRAVSYFFDGSGYALARNIERRGRFSQVTRFDIEVRTPTDNGLILLMINGVSTESCWYPLSMSTTSSPVLTVSRKTQNVYVLTFNFWKEEILGVCLVHGGNGDLLCELAPGNRGCELDSALIQRHSGLQTSRTLVITLWERLQLRPVVAKRWEISVE